jgi:hypothetical protein
MSNTGRLIFIRDERDEIVGAQVEESYEGDIQAFIAPSQPGHTLHRISDVPTKIFELASPDEFFKAFTQHLASAPNLVTKITAEELATNLMRARFGQQEQ